MGGRGIGGGITAMQPGDSARVADTPLLDFVLEVERLVVSGVERDEPVFVIEPRSPHEWGLFAYHIGNRHQPLMITGSALVCPDVPGVEHGHHGEQCSFDAFIAGYERLDQLTMELLLGVRGEMVPPDGGY